MKSILTTHTFIARDMNTHTHTHLLPVHHILHCQRGFCLFKTFGLQEEPQSENALVQPSGHSGKGDAEASGNSQETAKHPYLVFMKRASKRTGPVLAFARMEHVTHWITEPALFWRWINLLTNSPTTSCTFCSLFWPYYYIWLWSNVWRQARRQHKNHISFRYIPSLNVFSVRFRVSLVFHH